MSDRVRVESRGSPGGGGEEAGEPQHRLVALKVAEGREAERAPWTEGWGARGSEFPPTAAAGQGAVCLGERVGGSAPLRAET